MRPPGLQASKPRLVLMRPMIRLRAAVEEREAGRKIAIVGSPRQLYGLQALAFAGGLLLDDGLKLNLTLRLS